MVASHHLGTRVLRPQLADHPGWVDVLIGRAYVETGTDGDPQDELVEEAEALARRINDRHRAAHADWLRGEFRLLRGNSTEARRLFEAALRAYEELGVLDGVGWLHHHLGWAAAADANHQRARDHFERAVEVARSDPLGEWLVPHALAALAPLVARLGHGDEALQLADEAIATARDLAA